MANMLIIKINVLKLGVTKTFQFEPTARVDYVIAQVQDKVAGIDPKPNENYGLFIKDKKDGKKSFWLLNSRTLSFYDMQTGAELQYLDKNRYLKVVMLDGTVKTVLVDDSKSVGHALDIICEKIGITNSDEYSLLIEDEKKEEKKAAEDDEDDEANLQGKVGTLKKMGNAIMHRVDEHEAKKVQVLKRKAHTDDDTHWLANQKTLREAGVQDDSLVVIRRRYVYEQSVNITNPKEINLAYVQSRDAILDGSHPCSMLQAAKFAAYQIQIQHGDFDELRYKTGFIEVSNCLPKEYAKGKDVVKLIKQEHAKLNGLVELDAKYKYIQLCQNLQTYGVTFFLVREKMKGKNKLEPRLLGVNKESVMRVDQRSKEVLKVWPLTTIKNWASSPNSFTMDFGGYTEGMVSVQTLEGEQISQLISGYIDIIMKRMQKIKFTHAKDDDIGIVGEDTSVPSKMRFVQQRKNNTKETLPQYGKMAQIKGSLSPGQQALTTNLDNSGKAVLVIYDDLQEENPYAELEPYQSRAEGDSEEFSLDRNMGDIYASVASVLSRSANDPDEEDYTAVGAGISKITANLKDLSKHLRFRANGLPDEDGNDLLDAARKLADAFKDLMFSLNPMEDQPREDVLLAANKMSEAGICIEHILQAKQPTEYQTTLKNNAVGVEKASTVLVENAEKLAATLDEESAMKIHKAAEQAKQKASELLTCTNMLSLYLDNEDSKKQMLEVIQNAGKDLNALSGLCLVATSDEDLLGKLRDAAQDVTDALNNLLQNVSCGGGPEDDTCTEAEREKVTEKNVYEMILDANDALFRSLGDPDEMIRQATILGQATSQLIKGLHEHADAIDDNDERDKLLAAAKGLTDATAGLLTAARIVRDNPESAKEQENLKSAAVYLRLSTNHATSNALKKTLVIKLNSTAKQAVQAATHVISTAKAAAPFNSNPLTQQEFNEASGELISQSAKELIHAVKDCESKLGNPTSQLNLITSVKFFLPAASKVVALSKAILPTVTQSTVKLQLAEAGLNAEKILNDLKNAAEKAAEGQEECDRAMNAINKSINDLDQAMLAAISDNLNPSTNDSIKNLEEKILTTCAELNNEIPDIVDYSQHVPEQIGPGVIKYAEILRPLADDAIGFAANLSSASQKQTEILDLAKTVFESSSQLVAAAKDAGGNPAATKHHAVVEEASDNLIEALRDMVVFVKGTTGDMDTITYLMSSIDKVKDEVTMRVGEAPSPVKSYVEYQENMVKALKAIAKDAHDIVGKAERNPRDASYVCEDLYSNYHSLSNDTKYAVIFINPEVGDELIGHVQTLGDACKELIQSAGQFQVSSEDTYMKQDMHVKAKAVSIQVARILTDLQRGSIGTKACDDAYSMLAGLIGDIDTNIMFAEAGTLNPEDGSKFSAHRDVILLNSQNFVRETKVLVSAAHGAQDQLAASVTEVLNSTNKLIDSVKLGAASLGSEDTDGQMLLLNAVKNVAAALSDLMAATRNACGKSKDDPAADELKIYAKHMVGNLTSLLKTVRSVEDTASRGSRAVESASEAIKQAAMHFQADDASATATAKASPEDLILATKGISLATAKTVSAGNSLRQADIIEAANIGRKHCIELFEVTKAAVASCESDSIRNAVIIKVKESANAYTDVLDHVGSLTITATPQAKQQLNVLSKKVAYSVGEVVKVARLIKGSDLVNPEDPNVIAENELFEAASAIEAAAKKLSELKPKARPKAADESLNFEEQILEAGKSIANAAHTLVKAATLAQRELVAKGLICSPASDPYADTQWSQGLISAARLVAEATSALCEAANDAVLGNASQEKLIASAQAVSSSTTQLLLACRVKADTFSTSQKGLQAAGSAVKRATDALVHAAEEAAVFNEDEVDGYVPSGRAKTGRLIDEMNAQVEILRREKELEKARKKLEQIRLDAYRNGYRPTDSDEEGA